MAWLLWAIAAQAEAPWDLLRAGESIGPNGHVSALPPAIRALEGKWVTVEGFALSEVEDGALKRFWATAEAWFELEKFGTPRTPFNSIRIAFRPGSMPPDLQSYESLRVSGRFRIRREASGGKIEDLYWLVDAAEGRREEPKEVEAPPAGPAAEATNLAYSTLARGPEDPAVRALHGRWVTISGNVLTTTAEEEVKRFLLAKNPWDGCCLGTPPTAYDSISVRLTRPLGHRFARTATVSGRFLVQPLEIHGEMAELYSLADAVEGEVSQACEPRSGFPWTWVLLAAFAALTLGTHFALRRPKAPQA
jgi:hypothetical protein